MSVSGTRKGENASGRPCMHAHASTCRLLHTGGSRGHATEFHCGVGSLRSPRACQDSTAKRVKSTQ